MNLSKEMMVDDSAAAIIGTEVDEPENNFSQSQMVHNINGTNNSMREESSKITTPIAITRNTNYVHCQMQICNAEETKLRLCD